MKNCGVDLTSAEHIASAAITLGKSDLHWDIPDNNHRVIALLKNLSTTDLLIVNCPCSQIEIYN